MIEELPATYHQRLLDHLQHRVTHNPAQIPRIKQAQPYIVPPCRREIRIIYQDADLLLVDKPELLLSIPGRHPSNSDSLISRLKRAFPTASIVHRLDLDTSGIMVVPLKKTVHANISRQFQEREVEKTYTAMVYGLVDESEGRIDLPIARDWQRRPLQKICHETGKEALTRFQLIERLPQYNCSRLLLKPTTGRSHQLRIHMAAIGHPILGCDLYAHEQAFAMTNRLMLHATTLSFTHPGTGENLQGQIAPDF